MDTSIQLRILMLESMGFMWSDREAQWQRSFNHIDAYGKANNGSFPYNLDALHRHGCLRFTNFGVTVSGPVASADSNSAVGAASTASADSVVAVS